MSALPLSALMYVSDFNFEELAYNHPARESRATYLFEGYNSKNTPYRGETSNLSITSWALQTPCCWTVDRPFKIHPIEGKIFKQVEINSKNYSVLVLQSCWQTIPLIRRTTSVSQTEVRGTTSGSTCSPWLGTQWGWATPGGSPTSPIKTEEVSPNMGFVDFSDFPRV